MLRSFVALEEDKMSANKHPPRQHSAYVRPTSVVAMLFYSSLLVAAGLIYFLGYMPPLWPQADTGTTIDVPAALTKEDTLGYR
jgi:hypothetical protein